MDKVCVRQRRLVEVPTDPFYLIEHTARLTAVSSQRFMKAPAVGSLDQGAHEELGPRLIVDCLSPTDLHAVALQESVEELMSDDVSPQTDTRPLDDEHGSLDR